MSALGTVHCGQSPPTGTVNRDGIGSPYVTGPEQWDGKSVHLNKWTTDPKRFAPARSIFVTVKGAGVGTLFPGVAAAIGRDVYAFEPADDVDDGFVMYALKNSIDELKSHAVGDIPGLSRSDILDHAVSLPPLDEQRRIVAKLDALRARSRRAKEALDEVPALLDRLRQSILASAFRGDLTADWRAANPDVEPASALLARIRVERRKRWEEAELAKLTAKGKAPKDAKWKSKYVEPEPVDESELPELPEGWCWASLREIADIKGGVTKGQKRGATSVRRVPYLRVANVQRGYLDLRDVAEIETSDAELHDLALKDGDILFNEGGDRDKLGRGWVWEGQLPLCVHQNHVFRGRVGEWVEPKLISHYANSFGQAYFLREASQTTNLASINITKLGGLPLPLMPQGEQQVALARIEVALASIGAFSESVQAASDARVQLDSAILAAAFRGELT